MRSWRNTRKWRLKELELVFEVPGRGRGSSLEYAIKPYQLAERAARALLQIAPEVPSIPIQELSADP